MESLGPGPAARLEATRLGDRDSRQREPHSAPRKAAPQAPPSRASELDLGVDLENGENSHQLDERA